MLKTLSSLPPSAGDLNSGRTQEHFIHWAISPTLELLTLYSKEIEDFPFPESAQGIESLLA